MGTLLHYNMEVTGLQNVDRALSSLEARFARHNARVARMLGAPIGGSKGGGGGIAARSPKVAANREMQGIGKAMQQIARVAEREHMSELRRTKREETAKISKIKRVAEAERVTRLKDREAFVTGTVGNSARRVGGALKSVGTAGAALVGIGGAGLAASAVGQAGKLDEEIRRMLVGGRGAGEKLAHDPNDVRKSVMATATKTGIAPEDIASGMRTYVGKTGDVEGAIKNAETFATVAQATGASFDEVAQAASALSNNLGVTDINDMAEALAGLNFQGKKGSFEFKDMASLLDRITAGLRSKGVAGLGSKGAKDIGGMLQIVQKGTGNAEVTASSVDAMFRQLVANSAKLKNGTYGGKVNVFKDGDAKKGLREDMGGLVADVLGATKGDAGQLNKLLGDEGMKGFNPFIDKFREASGGGKDVKAGKKAVTDLVAEYSNVKGSYKDVQADAVETMKSFDVQMSVISTQLKDVVASELFPEMVKLGPQLKELVPYVKDAARAFVGLAKFLLSNPFVGIGGLIAGSIAADIAKAKLGSVVSNGIKSLFGTKTGVNGEIPSGGFLDKTFTKGGKTTVGGALGAGAAGAAIGITLASAIFTAGVVNFENAEVNMKESGKKLNDVRDAGVGDLDKVREAVEEQRKKVNEIKAPGMLDVLPGSDFLKSTLNPSQDVELKTQESFLAEMEKKLQVLDTLKAFGDQMKAAGVSQEEAAKKMAEAAKKLGVDTPNRGNSPSPVKP